MAYWKIFLKFLELGRGFQNKLTYIIVHTGDGMTRADGIFISRLMLGGLFDTYGILSVGDEIVKMNDTGI